MEQTEQILIQGLTPRQMAARKRRDRELENDPEHYSKLGRKGGQKKVTKGIGKLSKEARSELAKTGAQARHRKSTEV